MESPPSSKIKKRVVTWSSIVIILVVSVFGLLKLGIYYSSDILYQLVKNETNGYYQISFHSIDIDVWNKAIKLKNVVLKPDSTKDFSAIGIHNLYDLELSGLHIDLESISSIYLDRKLVAEHVRISDPQLHITRDGGAPKESFSLQTGNLYKQISEYLKVLKIDFFTIENAELAHSPSDLGLGNIDFFVGNLLIDAASNPNKEFYSESIELEIKNQSFELGDNIHQLSFDRFLLSTEDSVLTFENLVLKPISETHGRFEKEDKIVYDISIPELKLKGVDYFSAYRKNHLDMKELSLAGAHILFEEQTHGKKKNPSKKGNSLIKQLFKIFDEVKIDKMRLINTNLDLTTNDDENHKFQHIKSKRADIVLYNVLIDSTNYHFDHRAKYFEDVDIIIKKYSSFLPDSIHTINFDLLQMSSFDSSLMLKEFKISNDGNGGKKDNFIDIDIPLIRLKGLRYLDFLVNQNLIINEMQLNHPSITFENSKQQSGKNKLTPNLIYTLISNNFNEIGINRFQINDAKVSINNKIKVDGANLLVSNFNLNRKTHSWYDIFNDANLTLEGITMKDDDLDLIAKHLNLNHEASSLQLHDLSLNYLDLTKSVNATMTKLNISGINLDSLSHGNFMAFNSIELNNPRLNFEIFSENSNNTIKPDFGNKFIHIINGKIEGKTTDSSFFSLDEFHSQLSVGAVDSIYYAQAKNINFTLPKAAHKLAINTLEFSSEQNISLFDITIQNIQGNQNSKHELNTKLSSLTIYGIDQFSIWQNKIIKGDSLIIDAPKIDLNLNDIASSMKPKDSYEVQFQKVRIEQADLNLSDQRQNDIENVKISRIDLELNEFHYPIKSVLNSSELLYSDDLRLNIEKFQPTLTNGDTIGFDQLNYHKKNGLLEIDGFMFNQNNSTTSALLPKLKVVGFDIHAYLNEQRISIDSVEMKSSSIVLDRININPSEKNKKNSLMESVEVKYFSATETEIQLTDGLNPTSLAVHHGNFKVMGFMAEGSIVWRNFFSYAQFVSLDGNKLSIPLGDGYQIGIEQYDLHHPNNTLTFNDIKIKSEFSAVDYSSALEIQNDWFDVSLDEITFNGLDFNRLLGQKELNVNKVLLDGLNALVYRDKSVPFKSLADKQLPQSILKNIDERFYIDTLQLKGNVVYQEKPADKNEVAEISFNDLDAYLLYITSVDSLIIKPLQLIANGKVAANGVFQINATFDMNDINEKYYFTGQVDQMQLGALNKMLRPVANINIKDGYAERIWFDMEANKEFASGEMKFRYNNLKIQILNKESHDLKGLGQGIKTFFANTFVVKHKNPNFIFLRTGKIFHPRDSSRAIFNSWGKSLLSGAVSSVGIHKSDKAAKKYRKKINKH